MSAEVFFRHSKGSVQLPTAVGMGWTSRDIEIMSYGRARPYTEKWIVFFADHEARKIVATFKDEDVSGFTFYTQDPDSFRFHAIVKEMEGLFTDTGKD